MEAGAAREFFAEPEGLARIDGVSDSNDCGLRSREIPFDVHPGLQALATVIDPDTGAADPG